MSTPPSSFAFPFTAAFKKGHDDDDDDDDDDDVEANNNEKPNEKTRRNFPAKTFFWQNGPFAESLAVSSAPLLKGRS